MFKAKGSLKNQLTVFYINGKFTKRHFMLSAIPPKGTQLFDVRITTPTALGIVAADVTKCKVSTTKASCTL